MKQIKAAVHIAWCELLKWKKDPKCMVLLFFAAVIVYQVVSPAAALSRELGYRVSPWVYPFIYFQSYWQLVLSFCFILLISNAPFIDINQRYVMIRSGRKVWASGSILYTAMASFLYNAMVLLLSVLVVLPHSFLTLDWGTALTSLAYLSPDSKQMFLVSRALITLYSPLEAVIHTLLLQSLLGVLLGEIMFALNLLFRKPIGTVVSVIVVLSRLIIPDGWAHLSPATIANLDMVDSLGYSYGFFLIAITVFWLISVLVSTKSEIDIPA